MGLLPALRWAAKAAGGRGVAAWPMWLVAEECCKMTKTWLLPAVLGGDSQSEWGKRWLLTLWVLGRGMLLLWRGLLPESQNHAQPSPQQRRWAVLTRMTNAKRGLWFVILDFIKSPSSSPNLSLCLLSASWGELPPLPQGLRTQSGLRQGGTKIVWQWVTTEAP